MVNYLSKKYLNKSIAMKDEYKLKKDYKLRNKIKKNLLISEKRYIYNSSL
jgi:hypothetical protein